MAAPPPYAAKRAAAASSPLRSARAAASFFFCFILQACWRGRRWLGRNSPVVESHRKNRTEAAQHKGQRDESTFGQSTAEMSRSSHVAFSACQRNENSQDLAVLLLAVTGTLGEGGRPSPLLGAGEATVAVLRPVLGSPVRET